MRTRRERRYLTARAIKRRWSRYLQTQCGLICGRWWSTYSDRWCNVHDDQHQPHRFHKRTIDNKPDWWPGRRHNMDWDAPPVSDFEDRGPLLCLRYNGFSNTCDCCMCIHENAEPLT